MDLFKEKKAQSGILAAIILFLMFFAIWAIWLGDFISQMGQQAVVNNNLTGIVAFVFWNLNIFIIFGLIIGLMVLISLGSR